MVRRKLRIYYSLTESIAVLDKGTRRDAIAMDMAACIITEGRAALQETYPKALYEGEYTDPANASAYPSIFPEPLTVQLLERHQEISEKSKGDYYVKLQIINARPADHFQHSKRRNAF